MVTKEEYVKTIFMQHKSSLGAVIRSQKPQIGNRKLTATLFCFRRNIGVSGKKMKMTVKRSVKATATIGNDISVEYAPKAKLITTPMCPDSTFFGRIQEKLTSI